MRRWQALTVGEVLDQALALYRVRPWPYLGLGAFGMLPFVVIAATWKMVTPWVLGQGGAVPVATSLTVIGLVGLVAFLFFYPVSSAAVVALGAGDYSGQPITLMQAVRQALRVTPKLWVTYLCKGVSMFGMMLLTSTVSLVSFVPLAILGSSGRGGLATVIAFVVVGYTLLVLGIFAVVAIHALTTPAVVLENQWHFAAVGRTLALAFHKFFRYLWLLVVAYLVRFPVLALPNLLGAGLGYVGVSIDQTWLLAVLVVLVQALIFPLSDLVHLVAFFDLRVRKEAWDVEQTLLALEGVPPRA